MRIHTHFLAIGIALVCLAAPAGANTYCVGAAAGSCDGNQPGTAAGLQAGLGDAQANPGPDTVRIGPESYGGQNFSYTAGTGNAVQITGSGQATTISSVAFGTGLALDSPGSVVENLTFHTRGGVGLALVEGTAQDLWFDSGADPTLGNSGIGAQLYQSAAVVRRATVTVGPDSYGLQTLSGSPTIEDSTFTGVGSNQLGIGVDGPSTPTIRRIRTTNVSQAVWVAFTGAHPTLTDSLILVPHHGTGVTVSDNNNNSDHTASATLERVTVAPMAGAVNAGGVELRASPSPNDGDNFTALIRNSVLLGDRAVECVGGASTAATLAYTYHPEISATCAPGETNRVTGDAAFVDPAANDYRLRWNSALVDAADTTGYSGGETDVIGTPRAIDGDGNGANRIDVGAYEYPRQAPSASAAAAPSTAAAGTPVSFNGSGSDPDAGNEPLTYSWSFDDGGSASGQNVTHAFATPGEHTATVTVSDPTGLTATASTTVTVTEAPEEQQEEQRGEEDNRREDGVTTDVSAPSISGLSITPSAFRLGRSTVIGFSLSEPATVTLAFERVLPGRRKGTSCVKPSRAPRRAKRCKRYVAAGSLPGVAGVLGANSVDFAGRLGGRTLKPGRYQVRVSATDAAHNSAASSPASFSVRPKPRRRP